MKFTYKKSGVSKKEVDQLASSLEPYRKELAEIAKNNDYPSPESAIQLPYDEELLERVQDAAKRLHSPTLQYVIVVGIGGSNLGTQAVYEAIAGSMNLLVDRLPKLVFLDTISDEKMTAVTRTLEHMTSKDDFLIISISKSGSTTETLANTEVLWAFIKEQFGSARDRFVFITDEGSKLWNMAQQYNIDVLSVPTVVCGRFSVFSAVGLLPLALAQIDIKELLHGARRAVADGTSNKQNKNHSLVSACITYLQTENDRTIHNTFLFSPKLESLGKWYRQLMGESLGKDEDLDGNPVDWCMTPIVSIGSTDLHSMAQLYWGGADDKFTNMVFSFSGDVHSTPAQLAMPGLVPDIHRTSLEFIMKAIYEGTKSAYEKKNRPYVEIDLVNADARELGYYMQFRMLEMMYLGRLLNLNTFNQPTVEMYKEVTRKRLKERR